MVASQGEAAGANAVRMAQVYLEKAFAVVEQSARKVIAAVAEGDMLRTQMTILRRLAKHEPMNTIALRQHIAERIIEAGRYTV
jgi:butyryl-CoA dehydrogenase